MKKGKLALITISSLSVILLACISIDYAAYAKEKSLVVKNLDIGVVHTDFNSEAKGDLLGLIDSLGVPIHSESGDGSFFSLMLPLSAMPISDGETLSLFNLYANKTWHVQGLLENGITFSEMSLIKRFGIDFNMYKFPDVLHPNIVHPETSAALSQIKISDFIAGSDSPIVIYTCGGNDLFYYYSFNPANMNLQKIFEVLSSFDEFLLRFEINLRRNVELFIDLNHSISIFVCGLYNPVPAYLGRPLDHLINRINMVYQKVCDDYAQAHYVDITDLRHFIQENDFHPSNDGQMYLYTTIVQALNTHLDSSPSARGKVAELRPPVFHGSSTLSDIEVRELANQIAYTIGEYSGDNYIEIAILIEREIGRYIEKNLKSRLEYQDLALVWEALKIKLPSTSGQGFQLLEQAYTVLLIERKIETNQHEYMYTHNNGARQNDKLLSNTNLGGN